MDRPYLRQIKLKEFIQVPSNRAHLKRRQIKTKNYFFSTNRYEVLSQDDPPLPTPPNDNNIDSIQNPTGSINAESKALRPPPIFVRGIFNFN